MIDDLVGYELYANNNDDANEEMYQIVLFQEKGGYYIFMATYLKEYREEAIKDIKKVIETFRVK